MVLLGYPSPWGYFLVCPSRLRSTSLKNGVLRCPEAAQFSHPITSSIAGWASHPRVLGMAPQSRTQATRAPASYGAPSSPLAGSAWGSCAAGAADICTSPTRGSCTTGAATICAGSARGAALQGPSRGGGRAGGGTGAPREGLM